MGYTTEFSGEWSLTPAATPQQVDYINKFCQLRHVKRDIQRLMAIFKGKHGKPIPFILSKEQQELVDQLINTGVRVSCEPTKYPKDTRSAAEIYGVEGEFFVPDDGDESTAVLNPNMPPMHQPELYCQWELSKDGTTLTWDGGEKFYGYIEWIKYLIKNFFEPWGIKLNGEMEWSGEDSSDLGIICIKDNVVTTKQGKVSYH